MTDRAPGPRGGPPLAADLRAAVARLRPATDAARPGPAGTAAPSPRIVCAAMLSALGDHVEALAEADRAIAQDPASAEAWLLRARVHRRAGDRIAASVDIERGLALAPGDPRLQTLRGQLLVEEGRPARGSRCSSWRSPRGPADRPTARRPGRSGNSARSRDRSASGPSRSETTPKMPTPSWAARCFIRLGRWDPALADLESALDWSGDRLSILIPTAVVYAACVHERPSRLTRILGLACRAARDPFH